MRRSLWIAMAIAVILAVFGMAHAGEAEKKGTDPEQKAPVSEAPPKDQPPAEKKAAPADPTAGTESKTPDKVIADNRAKGFYTILVLHKGEDSAEELLAALELLAKEAGKIGCLAASVKEASLDALFKSLKLDPEVIPTPLALALAPNGIVTGAFRSTPKAEKFAEAILPEQPLAIRKALSDSKSVIIKMQSPKTSGNEETNKALGEYFADPKNQAKFTLLPLDLDKAENVRFLKQLTIADPGQEKQAILIAMAPPLTIISKPYRGAASKAVLNTFLASCGSACGPGST